MKPARSPHCPDFKSLSQPHRHFHNTTKVHSPSSDFNLRADAYREAKPPSVSILAFFLPFLLPCSSSFSPSFIYLNPTHTTRAQFLPLKMYLAELTRNLKQALVAFNSSWKAEEICHSVWVKLMGELLPRHSNGDGDYRQNLCTKLTSILQPGLTHILAHMARTKMNTWTGKTKSQPAGPLSYLWQNRNQKRHHSNIFWHIFIEQVFFLSLPWDNRSAQSMAFLLFFSLTSMPNWEIYSTALGSQTH